MTQPPTVLVACEYSGVVRRAFAEKGAMVWSCDILPSEDDSPYHIQGDVLPYLRWHWNLVIAHPPCTYLTNAGVRWLYTRDQTGNRIDVPERWEAMYEGAEFFRKCLNANADHVAVENPIMHSYGREYIGRRADQTVQPWMFGHPEQKATCLWLNNLPTLEPTDNVYDHMMTLPIAERTRVHWMSPGPERSKERSRTYEGIAQAMADQWYPIIEREVTW
jgi:hypothetical protein